MVLGAVWCPQDKVREIGQRLKDFKSRHALSSEFEIKWSKVGSKKTDFYKDIIDYFFDDDDLHFRALIIPDKDKLDHKTYRQSHDDWYYKMYFELLKVIIDPKKSYKIYLDIKDTRSAAKMAKLHEILSNAHYDFSMSIIKNVVCVRSEQVPLIQLADLLLGAVSYKARMPYQNSQFTNAGKQLLIKRIVERSGYSLTKTTLLREQKFNLFFWRPGNGGSG